MLPTLLQDPVCNKCPIQNACPKYEKDSPTCNLRAGIRSAIFSLDFRSSKDIKLALDLITKEAISDYLITAQLDIHENGILSNKTVQKGVKVVNALVTNQTTAINEFKLIELIEKESQKELDVYDTVETDDL